MHGKKIFRDGDRYMGVNANGSIGKYEDKNGIKIYKVSYRYYDPETKSIRQTTKRFKKERAAKDFLATTRTNMMNNSFTAPQKSNVREFFEKWFLIKKSQVCQNTSDIYRNHLDKHIFPYIGDLNIQKLTEEDIINLYTQLKKDKSFRGGNGLSDSTIKSIHKLIRQVIKYGLKKHYLSVDIMLDVKPSEKDVGKFEAKYISMQELGNILKAIKSTCWELPTALGGLAGLRRGEVLGLRWQDIDFKNRRISIRGQWVWSENGWGFGDTKTKGSVRQIPINAVLFEILSRKKLLNNVLTLYPNAKIDAVYVVSIPNAGRESTANFTKNFQLTLKKHGFRRIRFHDLRHSFCTEIDREFGIVIASRIIGHTNINTTEAYVHTNDNDFRNAVDFLGEIVQQAL